MFYLRTHELNDYPEHQEASERGKEPLFQVAVEHMQQVVSEKPDDHEPQHHEPEHEYEVQPVGEAVRHLYEITFDFLREEELLFLFYIGACEDIEVYVEYLVG